MPLRHLNESQVHEIAARATALNLAFPASEGGINVAKGISSMLEYLDSPELAALNKSLRALSAEARHELVAVMWLGRGDSGDDFDALFDHVRESSDAGDIDYITEKAPSLPVYLERGLAKLTGLTGQSSATQ